MNDSVRPSPSPASPLPPLVGGRYEVLDHIDEGGVALVFLARDLEAHRRVAIKVLRPSLAGDADARERMRLEAEAGRRLHHPNVVRLFDAGEQDGLPYLVLELVEGPSLRELVRQRGPLPPRIALELMRQASCGLSVMHGLGLVHRDVKPGNVIIAMSGDRPDRAKVADLGFVRLETKVTEETCSMGTLAFMSPEQALAEPVDARTDVYGLGVTLFYALTGELPFEGNQQELLGHQLYSEPPPASWLASGLSPAVDRIIRCALRKVPANRYPNVSALRDDLERALYMRQGVPRGIRVSVSPDRYRPESDLGRELADKLSACCA